MPGLEEIYPWFIGPNLVAYSRWFGPAVYNSQIYIYDIGTNTTSRAVFNDPRADDSDPFDVGGNTIGFSSNRTGTYDLFLGDLGSNQPLHLSQISTGREDLGGSYTQVQSVSPNAPPVIASLSASASMVPHGTTVTLGAIGASDPDGIVTAVQFFNDMTGTGVVSAGEAQLIGTGVLTSNGWALTLPTTNLPLGVMTVAARAQDNSGDWSAVVSTAITIVSVPTAPGLTYAVSLLANDGVVSLDSGTPLAPYFMLQSNDPLNAAAPGMGWPFGLHISFSDVWTQLGLGLSGNPLFGGTLDSTGSFSMAIPGLGALPFLSGTTWWGMGIQQGPTGAYEPSNIASITFQ
ncbi:MAG: hypothetical protein HRU14_14075 [Planctomycetes bacterium]|nr:hypothetical protein [Planctomycetota bacterium]